MFHSWHTERNARSETALHQRGIGGPEPWKKKYVTPKKFGTITLFSPRVKEAEYKRTFMSNVVQNYFTGSYKEMVSFFVRDRKLSKSDLQDLMDQIEKEE